MVCIAASQGRIASGEHVFGPLIRKYLLDNTHRVSVELLPDKGLATQREAVERERLAAARAAMSEEELEAIIKETKELRERQVSCPSAAALHVHLCMHLTAWDVIWYSALLCHRI